MKGSFAKQVVIGIVGLIITSGLYIMSQTIYHVSNQLVNDALMVVAFGCFWGFLLYIFGSSFFKGLKYGAGMVLFIVLTTRLPQKWAGIFIVLCVIGFWVFPTVREYIYDRESNSPAPRNKRVAKKIKEYEEFEQILESENEEFLKSIGFGERTLILRTISGNFYQCIKGNEKYFFIYAGNEISGLDFEYIKTDFSDEGTYTSKKKDFSISRADITSIKYKAYKLKNVDFKNSGSIVIYFNGRGKTFQVVEDLSVNNMRLFFGNIDIQVKDKNESEIKQNLPVKIIGYERDKDFIARMKILFTALTVISMLIGAVFLFMDFNYKLMSVLCMGLFIAFFALYIRYDKIFSLEDERDLPIFTKNKINLTYSILIPGFAVGLRSILDFDIINYKMFWICTSMVFFVIMFIFFRFSDEYKRKKSSIAVIVFAAVLFAPSSVVQTNYIFDNSPESLLKSKIFDMRIYKGSKGPDEYILEVEISKDNKMEIRVSKEYYESVSVGDKVTVVEKQGFLKIPYANVNEE